MTNNPQTPSEKEIIDRIIYAIGCDEDKARVILQEIDRQRRFTEKEAKAQVLSQVDKIIKLKIEELVNSSGYCGIGEWREDYDLALFETAIDRLKVQIEEEIAKLKEVTK